MRTYLLFAFSALLFLSSCSSSRKASRAAAEPVTKTYSTAKTISEPLDINRKELLDYAKSFIGTPYKYGSINPVNGFDCSGFVYHVLTRFNINPPRSSYEYENVGKEVSLKHAKPGDLILFTGSDHSKIGHIGIVTENDRDSLKFIHAATSRNIGVIISDFSGYYKDHFVKVVRILK